MAKSKILIQLDTDSQPSVFDAVVAVDAGAEVLLRHGGVAPEAVRDLVHGAIFTRGMDDLKSTAVFVGGSDVAAGEALLEAATSSFFGPMRVSVMMDANGSNTTAAAAVLTAAAVVPLRAAEAAVLGATGPVGQRAVRLLAREGAHVRVVSRDLARAEEVCQRVAGAVDGCGPLTAVQATSGEDLVAQLTGVQVLIAAGAAGVQLIDAAGLARMESLAVAIDLNAVPPAGIESVEVQDDGVERGGFKSFGAIAVGGRKMKIHKAAIRSLFEANDVVLDADAIFEIGRELTK